MIGRIATLTGIGIALSISSAAAQPSATEPVDGGEPRLDRRDRSSLAVTTGLFAPTGGLGVEYAHALHPNFEIAAGAGLGYLIMASANEHYKVTGHGAVMPRAKVRFGALRLHGGVGVSGGQEQFGFSPFSGDEGVDRMYVLWAHAEVGAALVSRTGWFGRATLGESYMLNHGKTVSSDPNRAPMSHDDQRWMPYVGLAFGRTL